eukprot:jgi/Mesvir1/13017/Mv26287-RA.1
MVTGDVRPIVSKIGARGPQFDSGRIHLQIAFFRVFRGPVLNANGFHLCGVPDQILERECFCGGSFTLGPGGHWRTAEIGGVGDAT